MDYGNWFAQRPHYSGFIRFTSTTPCTYDVLRFIAEEGDNIQSLYDIEHGIKPRRERRRGRPLSDLDTSRDKQRKVDYSHPTIIESINELAAAGLIKTRQRKDAIQPILTAKGLLFYFAAWKKEAIVHDQTSHLITSFTQSISKQQNLLPVLLNWTEITQLVGEHQAVKSLLRCAQTSIIPLQFEIQSLDLVFQAFMKGIAITPSQHDEIHTSLILQPEVRRRRGQRNHVLVPLLQNEKALLDSYIAFLIREDLVVNQPQWISEQEMSFFNKTNVQNDAWNERLLRSRTYLKACGTMKHMFTGMLLDELMWDEIEYQQRPPTKILFDRKGVKAITHPF